MGTRPEGIKMAPVVKAIEAADGLEPIVVSTAINFWGSRIASITEGARDSIWQKGNWDIMLAKIVDSFSLKTAGKAAPLFTLAYEA